MERWQGRVAIVSGASAGIGAAIAHLLAEHGMKVVAIARRMNRLQELLSSTTGCKGEMHILQCDVRKEEDVLRVIKWTRQNLGGTDVLVNNAGVSFRNALTDINTEQMKQTWNVNVFGLCLFTREVLKDMRERGVDDGHIFHISSAAGQRIMDIPDSYLYAGTKHAVRVMTEGLRRELRDMKSKIRVTSISPGTVRTEIAVASGATEEQAKLYYESKPHLEPKDVAEALLYALSTPPHVQVHEITVQPIGQHG